MNLENIRKKIKKYNGNLKTKDEYVSIYGTISENKAPDSIIGYDFEDIICGYSDGYFEWKIEVKLDKLIRKENKINKKDTVKSRKKQRKKFKVKEREKRERRLQLDLNEFVKEYNN